MNDTPQLLGLPLHPLLVHAVVVLLPVTVLALLLAEFWPAARRRLGFVTPALALVVAVLVPITVQAGEALAGTVGPLPGVQTHEAYGRMLIPAASALLVVAVAQWAWFRWGAGRRHPITGADRDGGAVADGGGAAASGTRVVLAWVLGVVVVGVAAWAGVLIVLTGESGARAVWGGLLG